MTFISIAMRGTGVLDPLFGFEWDWHRCGDKFFQGWGGGDCKQYRRTQLYRNFLPFGNKSQLKQCFNQAHGRSPPQTSKIPPNPCNDTNFCIELCLFPPTKSIPPPPQKKAWGLDKPQQLRSLKQSSDLTV